MDHFKRLPDEILVKVFSYLDAKSLIRCRGVSKRFKLWADDTALRELAIKGYETKYSSCMAWYHTGGTVARSDFFSVCTFIAHLGLERDFFDLFERMPLNLSKLQRIKIATFETFSDHFQSDSNARMLVQTLSRFVQLEHLEMTVVLELGKETLLKLPKLRILLLNSVSYHDLIIDAPRLDVLCCRMGLDRIKISKPETVRQIELRYGLGNLAGYASVEVFRCKCPERLQISSIDQILECCPKLKELHIETPDHRGIVEHSEIKILIDHLMAEKKRLERNLDAYLFGIKLNSEIEFEQQVPIDLVAVFHQPVFRNPLIPPPIDLEDPFYQDLVADDSESSDENDEFYMELNDMDDDRYEGEYDDELGDYVGIEIERGPFDPNDGEFEIDIDIGQGAYDDPGYNNDDHYDPDYDQGYDYFDPGYNNDDHYDPDYDPGYD